jgi:hypothetical protein
MIEAFRLRGIRPEAVGSLAVESVLLEAEDETTPPDPTLADIARRLLDLGAHDISRSRGPRERTSEMHRKKPRPVKSNAEWISQQRIWDESMDSTPDFVAGEAAEEEEPDLAYKLIAADLSAWIKSEGNAARLGLDPNRRIAVRGFHPVHRTAAGGELLLEIVVQYVQTLESSRPDLGGLSNRAGVTMIVTIEGRIRYIVRKPASEHRDKRTRDWVAHFDYESGPSWPVEGPAKDRLVAAFAARAMDRRRWR